MNCKLFLAIAPITNDGNIYWAKKFHFWDIVLQLWCNNETKIASRKKVPIRFPILRNNIARCGMKRYALESQRPHLFNASKTSFKLALETSMQAHPCRKCFSTFPDPEKRLNRNGKRTFWKAASNRMFSVHESVLRFRDAILRPAE